MACHHPNDGLLIAYAAGSLDEPLALLVATHLALCPACRSSVGGYESLGGVLLDEIEPEAVSGQALERLFERLDDAGADEGPSEDRGEPAPLSPCSFIPEPLRGYLGASPEPLPWHAGALRLPKDQRPLYLMPVGHPSR